MPETIHDIIAARVDRLADTLKHALQGAAVVGRQFAVALLARVLATNGQLAGFLHNLHELDFVFPSASEPEPMYSFKHALTQDVVYEGLLVRRRREYHGAAAAALEEFYAGRLDEVVELLAYHYARTEHAEKAIDYAILAGEKAQRQWANREALAHFESALARLRDDAALADRNLMPPIVDAARAYVTMGEMCDALREVWGVWRQTPVF